MPAKKKRKLTEKMKPKKEQLESFKESDERYKDLLDNANVLFQSVNAQGKFVYVNKKWKKVLGYSDEEIKKISLWNILRKDQLSHCRRLFKKVLQGQGLDHIETVFKTKKGQDIFVIGSANALFKDNKFIATRGIFKDVTEEKKAEEKLQEREDKYRKFVEASLTGIYQVDTSGKFIFVNKTLAKMLGYRQEELVGKNFTLLLPPKSILQVKKWVEEVFSGKHVKNEVNVRHKDGHEITVYFSAVPMKENGKIIGLSGNLIDITERKQAEEAIKKKTEELEKFNKMAVGRELKMIELKRKIKQLEAKLQAGK